MPLTYLRRGYAPPPPILFPQLSVLLLYFSFVETLTFLLYTMVMQKSNQKALATSDVSDILREYPTKSDLEKALEPYATKKDLQNLEKKIEKNMDVRLGDTETLFDIKLKLQKDEVLQALDEKFTKFTDRLITTFDPLLKELETRQEDRAIAVQQNSEAKATIQNHEKRITKLEKSSRLS